MKPEDAQPERSNDPAPDGTAAHPAPGGLWEQFLARENLAEALRRVEQTPVPRHRRDERKRREKPS